MDNAPQNPESQHILAQSIENIKALIVAESLAQQDSLESVNTEESTRRTAPANDAVFKKPKSLSAFVKRLVEDIDKPGPSTATVPEVCTTQHVNYKIVDANTNVIQSISTNRKKIDITTPDVGSKLYKVMPPYVTPTIVPKRLPEAFEQLPKVGRVNRADLEKEQHKLLREFLGADVNDDHFQLLERFCSPEKLCTGNELKLTSNAPKLNYLEYSEDDLDSDRLELDQGLLRTVDKYRMKLEMDVCSHFTRVLKYRGMVVLPLHIKTRDDERVPTGPADALEPGKDLIFKIRVYRPFMYHPKLKVLSNGRHPLLAYELALCGRQRLRELRERMVCINDVGLRLDVAAAPGAAPPLSCKELFPSGYFFINNIFYVDKRPGCHDLTAVVRDFAAKNDIGHFEVRDMDDYTLDQLHIKLGHPEVYIHQGDCEHLFNFSDVRLVSASDPLSLAAYPAHPVVARCQAVYCTTCAEFPAKYIVTGYELVPFDPALFCESCLQLYLYKDGKKLGDFKVYQFHYNDIGFCRV